MKQATLLQKLEVLGELLFSSPFFLTMFSATLLLIVVLFISTKKETKFTKLSCIFIYLTMLGIIIFKYNKSILSILDYIVENIFVVIYFPNLIIYITILLIVNIIMIITVKNKNISKFIKKINIFGFCFMHLLFFLILDSIVSNNIDVYSKMAIYTNSELLILLELSTGLFVVWMLILGINFCVNKITAKSMNEKEIKAIEEEIDIDIIDELDNDIEIITIDDNLENKSQNNSYNELDGLTLNDYKQIKSILKAMK